MATTAPGLQTVKPRRISTSPVSSRVTRHELALDEDPTEYPDSEVMCRELVENEICAQLMLTLRRYQAERGIVCFIGSDSFIYWEKGNIKACVSPDLYILPGIAQTVPPTHYPGSKDEQCWKTWIHQVAPNFAIEVKARRNPRKDELQSPARHDALGTKELVVFDPFAHRRRAHRRRFVVFRRDATGKLVSVLETNEHRIFCEQLDAFLIADGEGEAVLLRVGLGPNGERHMPFESELVEIQAQRAVEAIQRADEAMRMRQEEARMRQEETQRADEATRLHHEETQRADEATRRADELAAELALLRSSIEKPAKRATKK